MEENWVRFQFWISMILGVNLREKYDVISERISVTEWIETAVLFVSYFSGKVLVSKYDALSGVQFLSPMLLVILVYRVALIFIKLEKKGNFVSVGKWNQPAKFMASITLEIYLVQNVIIHSLSVLSFPVNFIVVTALIVAVARVVHLIAGWIQRKCSSLFKM